jgi:hypothetical protein
MSLEAWSLEREGGVKFSEPELPIQAERRGVGEKDNA